MLQTWWRCTTGKKSMWESGKHKQAKMDMKTHNNSNSNINNNKHFVFRIRRPEMSQETVSQRGLTSSSTGNSWVYSQNTNCCYSPVRMPGVDWRCTKTSLSQRKELFVQKKKKKRCWKHVFKKLHRLKEKGKRSQKGSKRRLEEEEVVLVVGTRWSVSSLVLVWSVSPLAAAKHWQTCVWAAVVFLARSDSPRATGAIQGNCLKVTSRSATLAC